MEELTVSPKELKLLIDIGIIVGEGYFGSVFTYQDRLIKIDKVLYNLLRKCSLDEVDKKIEYFYQGDIKDFDDIIKLEYLYKEQPNIKRTQFPLGAVFLKDVDKSIYGISPGIILPYHRGFDNLENIDKKSMMQILLIMKNLLLTIKELEEHHISQEDLYNIDDNYKKKYNIMYKGSDIKLIDVSGEYLKCGREYKNSLEMYLELGNVLLDFFEYYHIPFPYQRFYTGSFKENEDLVKEFEKEMKKI